MNGLENRIPPPAVAGVVAVLMWIFSAGLPRATLPDGLRLTAALACIAFAAGFCAAGLIEFRRARTTVNPLKPEGASTLVISGIYTITRNPMYVGFALFLVAWAAYLASPWALLGVVVFILYMNHFQIRPEERALTAIFGENYRSYQSRVRRWL